MFEQLPASGASNRSDASLKDAGQLGLAGGAPAPAGPHNPYSSQTHAAHEGAPDTAIPRVAAGAPNPIASPLGSHQGGGASSPADDLHPQPFAGSQDAPHTLTYVPVRAMEDVMACRHEQIFKHGHTPEKDREGLLWSARQFGPNGQRSLMHSLARQLGNAIEYAARGPGSRDVTRRALVRLAALCLAAIDWIDAEAADREADANRHP